MYHDTGIYALECAEAFRHDWVCIGRLAEIPERGDYLCRDIVGTPVVAIRNSSNSVKAFANVCAHRAARLLDGNGHVSRISCPYHSWTYDLDGQLVGAPFMSATPKFETRSYRLREFKCEYWQGFIYVSLNPRAAPLSTSLGGLDTQIGDFRMADYVPVYSVDETWNTNWKCLVENFMDAYHIHRVHKESFGQYSSAESHTELFDGENAYSFHYVQEDDEPRSVSAHADNTWLQGANRRRTYLINVFPSHTMQLQPDMLWYLSILPRGTESLSVRWAVSIPAEILDTVEDREKHIEGVVTFLQKVNSEDKPIIESVGRSTRAPEAASGPFSYLERNVWQFNRYLKRRLVGP